MIFLHLNICSKIPFLEQLTFSENYSEFLCEICQQDLENSLSIKNRFIKSQKVLEANQDSKGTNIFIKEEFSNDEATSNLLELDLGNFANEDNEYEDGFLEEIKSSFNHKSKRKKKSDEKFECSICLKVVGSLFALNRHSKCHEENQRVYPVVPCPVCGKIVRRDSLKRHNERVHLKVSYF